MSEAITGGESAPEQPEMPFQRDWEVLFQDELAKQQFDVLQAETRQFAPQLPECPEWVHDDTQLQRRWQMAVEVTALTRGKGWTNTAMTAADELKHALQSLTDSAAKRGWATPGLGIAIVSDGFTWTEEQGVEPQPHMLETIDLRDMDTPELVVTMTFDEFKTMTEEEVEALYNKVKENLERQFIGNGHPWFSKLPARRAHMRDRYKLEDYLKQRRFGVEDKQLTSEDVEAYLKDLVAARQTTNPAYGTLPATYDLLEESQREDIHHIFDYFDDSRAPEAQVFIDSYSLKHTLGFKNADINGLVDNGVLRPIDSYQGPDGNLYASYELAPEYTDFWWTSYFTEAKE